MSEENEPDTPSCCASRGIAEIDTIILTGCGDCAIEEACQKQVAELRDEILFRQPESEPYGDCPICLLPLPLDGRQSVREACCNKIICNGCRYVKQKRESEQGLEQKCPFCRHPTPTSMEEASPLIKKRIEANDPIALCNMGVDYCGEGDYNSAFEYWTKAAEMGDIHSHYYLSILHRDGLGCAEKNEKMELYHLEVAAIGGHSKARFTLGFREQNNDIDIYTKIDRSVKHWIIAANLGHFGALDTLKTLCLEDGWITKEDYDAAARAYQAAVDATKSQQREEAAIVFAYLERNNMM